MSNMPNEYADGNNGDGNSAALPENTGRYLVLLNPSTLEQSIEQLTTATGFTVARSSEAQSEAETLSMLAGNEAVVFEELGVAVVNTPLDTIEALAASSPSDILAFEPERYVQALKEFSVEYARGYRDAINEFVEKMLAEQGQIEPPLTEEQAVWGETYFTWGLQACKVDKSQYTGKGVRVAVLDTGFCSRHPDFAGRRVVMQSFVPGESPQDVHGHGTHCIGTACGPRKPKQGPRYGIACEADIFVGKVLNNQGRGTDSWILAGMDWALRQRCAVVSMSLGARVKAGQGYSTVFETVASRALAAGMLIVAAAGNLSNRPSYIDPVSHPANCPSIMAVGALTEQLEVAPFSGGGLNPSGGELNIAAPGVNVLSSTCPPKMYARWKGTSMATPHVAGIAALYAEANPNARGRSLAQLLLAGARALPNQSKRDVGVGLVQAP